MKKQKFSLDSNLVQLDEEKEENHKEKIDSSLTKQKELQVNITLAVDQSVKKDLKIWCAKNNFKIKEALLEGFELFKAQYDNK